MSDISVLTWVLRRERWIVIGGLIAVIGLSWLYLFQHSRMDIQAKGEMAMAMGPMAWSPGHFALILIMWMVMMAAMMLPSAAPAILLYLTITRRRRLKGAAAPAAGFFALGYGIVWAVFSLLATTLQWGLDRTLWLSPRVEITSVVMAGTMLIAAGLYQWSPLKHACLRQCQSPLDFLAVRWREGALGALGTGARHGLFCLGCCWLLMLLLFVGGAMNLFWAAGIALYVLVEKLTPQGRTLSRVAGVFLILWGVAALANAFENS